jgi:NADPH-dependent glutamate synthase beta subunit-like oxidoreductase
LKQQEAIAYTERCFGGQPASCTSACPFGLDIRAFLEKTGRGRWKQAYRQLRNAVVFPAVTAELCPAPCRTRCQRTETGDEPINLSGIERAVVRYSPEKHAENYVIPAKNGKIAVVGAGLSGLSAALALAQKKFAVTLFDRADGWGGVLRTHANFAVFDADFALAYENETVEKRFGTEIKSPGELDGFDAVFLATGDGGGDFGLAASFDPELHATADPRVFLGGGLVGEDAMSAIAGAVAAARTIEVFLATGKASATYADLKKPDCSRYVDHDGEPSSPLVAESADGYSGDAARAESLRCMQCDCNRCMAGCEMLARFRKPPRKISSEVYSDEGAAPPYSTHIITRETYSCNDCGYCKSVCPEKVDIGSLLHLSRVSRFENGTSAPALHDFWLREMDFNTHGASFVSAGAGRGTCEYLFFPGCQLGAMLPEQVESAYKYLNAKYETGVFLGCCGAPAYWAGRDDLLNGNLRGIRDAWETLGKPKFILACASCDRFFRELMPEIETATLYELLDPNDFAASEPYAAAVFDPCAARDNDAMRGAVRALAARSGIAVSELTEQGKCCGYGGLIREANPTLYNTVVTNRIEASEKPYIVYCANCRDVFRSKGKECTHILETIFGQSSKNVTFIAQKRYNSIKLRGIMYEITGTPVRNTEQNPWDTLKLALAPEVAERIDRKLIGGDELREAIYNAENGGGAFGSDDGEIQCKLTRGALTYWVRYRKNGGAFEVLDAFYHRMKIAGTAK